MTDRESRTAPGNAGKLQAERWDARRMRRGDVAGGVAQGFLYRPGHVLVATDHIDHVHGQLRDVDAKQMDEGPGVLLFQVGGGVDVPSLVSAMRIPRNGVVPTVSPNHVMTGNGNIMGGPATLAEPDTTINLCEAEGDGPEVTVAVIDTGIALHEGQPEDALLRSQVKFQPADAEELKPYPNDPNLGSEAGHGTFIAGIVRQMAPGATVDVHKVLNSDGLSDDFHLAQVLAGLTAGGRKVPQIINLSLGGYTHRDVPPPGVAAALASLGDKTVVLAAAGNSGRSRPWYPAAMKGVVAVGALQNADGLPAPLIGNFQPERAWYSNYGPWVDACAIGDWVSCFVYYNDPPEVLPSGVTVPARDFDGWARWSGTSFATPCVAGAIAALMRKEGIDAKKAAFRLIGKSGLKRVKGLGTVVQPPCLP